MANFPRPEDVRIPGIETAPVRQIDTSYTEIAQGAQQLAAGVGRAGAGIASYALQEKRQENTVDLSAAEAEWTKQKIAIKNAYQDRTDYEDFPDEAKAAIEDAKASAAALIRDDKMRASWVGDKAPDAMVFGDGFTDMAHGLKKADDTMRFETSIGTNAELIADPTVPDEVRNRARADVTGSLIRAIDTGLITREQGKLYRDKYLDGAEEELAINRGMIMLQTDPAKVMAMTGVSTAMGGSDVSGAALDITGGKLTLTPEIGAMVARELGDTAFPSDTKLAEAYLRDPEIQKRYTAKALDALTTKFNGDMTAALVALHPDGGEAKARQWQSTHDESVLAPSTRKFMRDTMAAVKAPADTVHLPVVAAPGIEMDNIDAGLLDRWEKAQSQFGQSLAIIGGKRSNLAAGMDGITVDTSKLSDEDKVRLIETASAMGFSGIGVSDDALHLDFGNKRSMGVDGGDVIPGWAKDVMDKHANGDIAEIPVAMAGVDPMFAKLSYEQRLKLNAEAQQQLDRLNVEKRAGIEIAADNAPTALMTQGRYDGYMPTAGDFVDAYGAADGIAKFKDFELQVDVANTAYGMRTMPMEDIANMLEDKKPTSTGDMAGYENKRYNALIEAAANIKEAREKDPAGYTSSVFPAVEEAMSHFGENADATKAAITAMATAQTKLGVEKQVLIPKAIEDKVVTAWKDKTLDAGQRFAPLISVVMATGDEGQQEAILKQMQAAGVPTNTTAIMRAMTRPEDGQSSAGYLMRAAAFDGATLTEDPDHKNSDIKAAVGALYNDGGIGQVYYGLNGTFHDPNLKTALDEQSLLATDARLLLMDNSSLTTEQAVAMAAQHMFGNTTVATQAGNATSAGMQITIPAGDDKRDYVLGFTALLPKVATALKQTSDPILGGITDRSLQALSAAVRDNDLKTTLRNGYFANAGNGAYQFLDEDGVAVVDAAGKLLVFTADEIKAAAKSASPDQVTRQRLHDNGYLKDAPANPYYPHPALTRDPFK